MIQRSKVWSATSVASSFGFDGTRYINRICSGSFLRLPRRQPLNALLVLAAAAYYRYRFTGKGRAARWPMSLLLWAVLLAISSPLAGASGGFCPLVSR